MNGNAPRIPSSQYRWLPLGVIVLAAYVMAISSSLSRWRGDWGWGMAHQAQALPVLMLATSFFAAWFAGDPRGGIRSWIERAPESSWRLLVVVLRDALIWPIVLMLIAVAAVAFITVGAAGAIDIHYFWMIGAQMLALLLAVLFGLLAARVLPQAPAAISATALVAVFLFAPVGGGQNLFETVGTGHAMPGLTIARGYFVWNLLWVGLATAVLLFGVVRPLLSNRVAAAVAVGAVLSLLVGSVGGTQEMFKASGREPDQCIEGSVELCVYPGYARLLDAAIPQFNRFFAAAQSQGVDRELFPDSYAQDDNARRSDYRGTLLFGPNAPGSAEFSASDVAFSVSTPLWCRAMYAEKPLLALLEDRQLVDDWAALILGVQTADEFAFRHPGMSTSSREIAHEIVASLKRINSCERN